MNPIEKAGHLLLGAALLAGCIDGNGPMGVPERLALGVSSASTSVVCDAIGDVAKKTPAWQDISRAEVTKSGELFVLTMDLAEPLPARPPKAPGGLGWYEWGWAFDTDPTTSPAGDPFPLSQGAPSSTAPFEFFVVLIWDGSAFQGILVDRRPLLSNRDIIVTPVGVAIEGAHVQLSVPSTLLGEPSTFEWAAFTEIRHAHWGTNGFQNPDGTAFATWPGQSVCP